MDTKTFLNKIKEELLILREQIIEERNKEEEEDINIDEEIEKLYKERTKNYIELKNINNRDKELKNKLFYLNKLKEKEKKKKQIRYSILMFEKLMNIS